MEMALFERKALSIFSYSLKNAVRFCCPFSSSDPFLIEAIAARSRNA